VQTYDENLLRMIIVTFLLTFFSVRCYRSYGQKEHNRKDSDFK